MSAPTDNNRRTGLKRTQNDLRRLNISSDACVCQRVLNFGADGASIFENHAGLFPPRRRSCHILSRIALNLFGDWRSGPLVCPSAHLPICLSALRPVCRPAGRMRVWAAVHRPREAGTRLRRALDQGRAWGGGGRPRCHGAARRSLIGKAPSGLSGAFGLFGGGSAAGNHLRPRGAARPRHCGNVRFRGFDHGFDEPALLFHVCSPLARKGGLFFASFYARRFYSW